VVTILLSRVRLMGWCTVYFHNSHSLAEVRESDVNNFVSLLLLLRCRPVDHIWNVVNKARNVAAQLCLKTTFLL